MIVSLPVVEGDSVEQGDLLLELWNDDIRAEFRLAQRDATAADSRAMEACVTADFARREADRLMTLVEEGLASEDDTDRAVGIAESSAAACQAVRDSARVAAARIEVTQAALERTRLIAPFAGTIGEINGELGEFVTPSPVGIPTPPTVDLIDSTCLYISAPIDEVDAPAVREGLPARISLDAFADRTFSGHVRRVAPYVLDVEKQARTVEIEAEIDDPGKSALLPGYSADVEVLLASEDDVVRIPSSILVDGNTVYVYDEASGQLQLREIETGISNWEFTAVTAGLRAGERVVTSIDRDGRGGWRLGPARVTASPARAFADDPHAEHLPELPGRNRCCSRARRCRSQYRSGRVHFHHGPIGFRKIHPVEHTRAARQAHIRVIPA